MQAAKSAGQPLTGRFRLGVIPTIAPFLLPKALPLLRERFPRLKLFLREDLTHRLIEALKAGALDAALIALPYDVAGLDYEVVGEDELLAMAPVGHPMTAQAAATVSMLQEGPDPAGGRALPARPGPGSVRPHAARARPRKTVRGDLPAYAGADGGLGARGSLLPAMAVEAGLADARP